MAIIDNKIITGTGFKKTIDADSLEMILDTLQVTQYSKPHASAIRECVSNAVDSETEKKTAQNILTGIDKIEDHYDLSITADNAKFEKDYYNLDYLTSESDVAIDLLIGRKDNKRALLRVTDHGVGLGGRRLEKSFNPGYSSKRGSHDTLGSFGLGNKAPLATGIDSYMLTSFYNGRKYKFKIYVNKVDCLISKFSGSTKNEYHEFKNGFHAFYEKTDQKNGVIMEWEIKQHNIDAVKSAITSQLMYFDNIKYTIREEQTNYDYEVDLSTDILYEDDNIIIPKLTNSHTYKPHILLGKEGKFVNYNFIDWEELELSEYFGGIGFKLSPSDVSINPSRENLVWDDKTKKAILDKFENAKEIVQNQLSEKLTETNFIKWNVTVSTILNNFNYRPNRFITQSAQDDIVKVLSSLIDTTENLELKYNNTDYEFLEISKSLPLKIDNTAAIRNISVYQYADLDIRRNPIHGWGAFEPTDNVYITSSDRADKVKDLYIADNLGEGEDMGFTEKFVLIHVNKLQKTPALTYLLDNSDVKDYDTVEVPEDLRALYQNKLTLAEMTPAQQRKLDKKVIVKRFYSSYSHYSVYTSKIEFKLSELPEKFENVKIIYGHRDDAAMLQEVAKILYKRTDIVVYLIAQNNLKYFKEYGTYVDDYIFQKDKENKIITLMPELTQSYRRTYIDAANLFGNYRSILKLSTIFENECNLFQSIDEIYNNIPLTPSTPFSNGIFKSCEEANVTNVSLKELNINLYAIANPTLIALLADGYTITPIELKEKKVIDKFKDIFKDIKSFFESINMIEEHAEQLKIYLTAIDFQFLSIDEFNELIINVTEVQDEDQETDQLFPASITINSSI